MDTVKHLGELAIGSRLRRLSDRLLANVNRIYQEHGINFETRWFLMFYQLHLKSPMSITEIAAATGFTHPAIIQLSDELIKVGLIASVTDTTDKRRRLISLSAKGIEMLGHLKPVWHQIEEAHRQISREIGMDLLSTLERYEEILDERDIYERVTHATKVSSASDIVIHTYAPRFKKYFKLLNIEWLKKFFTIEPLDRKILSHPETIIKDGGEIFFAEWNGKIVGTCAVLNNKAGIYELAKMAVTEKAQGKHIGWKLGSHAIMWAQKSKGKTMVLETSRKLYAALALYRKLGFVLVANPEPSKYERSTIKMELRLR